MTDLKSGSNKTRRYAVKLITRGSKRRIYYSIALTGAQFTTAVTKKFNLSIWQTILWSTIYPVWTQAILRKFPGQNTDLFFWINKVSDVSFSNSEQACLCCAGLHAAWHLSLGSYHTETHHYSPFLLLIKIIIVKFLLTTLKIQSDCFGIKHSQKHPTDFTHILSHMVLKCDKRYETSVIFNQWKSHQNVGSSGYFLACTILRTSFCWHDIHI